MKGDRGIQVNVVLQVIEVKLESRKIRNVKPAGVQGEKGNVISRLDMMKQYALSSIMYQRIGRVS